VCDGVWHLLEGTTRASKIIIGYDDPLPLEALGAQYTVREDP
jgi:hypothetical protein